MKRKLVGTPKKSYEFQVVLKVDEDGKYVAWCPALEACYTQRDTFEDAVHNIRDVIAICLEELRDANEVPETRYPEVEPLEATCDQD